MQLCFTFYPQLYYPVVLFGTFYMWNISQSTDIYILIICPAAIFGTLCILSAVVFGPLDILAIIYFQRLTV